MSRPIYEPTPARADAELGYGKRQLYRRPAQSPAFPGIDSAVYMEFVGATISDDALTNLTGGTVGAEVVAGDAMTIDNTTGRVTFVEDGIYLAFLNVLWDGTRTGLKMSKIAWLVVGDQDNAWQQDIIGETNSGINGDMIGTQSIRYVNITGGTNYLQGSVLQVTGSPYDIVTADLSVVQLSSMTFPVPGT